MFFWRKEGKLACQSSQKEKYDASLLLEAARRLALAMLQRGGNAVDAAVAAAFASFVSEVALVHLGGSGMAQIFDPQEGSAIVYDFFSDMPGLGQSQRVEIDFEPVTIDFITR